MSATLDVNVLMAAVNQDDPAHHPARELVTSLVAGPGLLFLLWPVVSGFVRVATHPRILAKPLTTSQAIGVVTSLLEQPTVRVLGEPNGFWDDFCAAQAEGTGGNDVPDAHIVALMRAHGIDVIHTQDRGFRRFDGIEVRPLA